VGMSFVLAHRAHKIDDKGHKGGARLGKEVASSDLGWVGEKDAQ